MFPRTPHTEFRISISFLILLILPILCGCKETPQKKQPPKPQYDIEKVSRNIERFTKVDTETEETPKIPESSHPILDLADAVDLSRLPEDSETDVPVIKDKPQRFILSQFPTNDTPKIVRVSISLKGVPRNQHDEVEERIWSILNAHAPQPWELRKPNTLEKEESSWATLSVEYKKQTIRLKRTSKTAPLRAELNFSFELSFGAPRDQKASWDHWKFTFRDEVAISSENAITSLFWQKIENELPALTVIQPDATAQWLRTQGLAPQILDNSLSAIHLPEHRYYDAGCLLSRTNTQNYELRYIHAPYAPAQKIDIASVLDMHCSRDATFILASETPIRVALYYQPAYKLHAWKTQLTFSDSIQKGDIAMHVDDDLICLYTGLDPQHNRGMEIQCLDRRTGILRWQTKRFPGALRGIAFDDRQIVAANDQGIFTFSRTGEILQSQRIQTSSRMRYRNFCQLQNRLVMMTGPGQFAAWNLDKNAFDWQGGGFESDFIHCGQQNTFLFSEVGGFILAYDIENQTPIWKFKTVTSPRDAFSYGDVIYLLIDRAILVLDRKTGLSKAQIPLPWMANQFIQIGHKLYLDTVDAVYTWR